MSLQDVLKRSCSFVSKSGSNKFSSDGSTTENNGSSEAKPIYDDPPADNVTCAVNNESTTQPSPSVSNDLTTAERKAKPPNHQRTIDIRKVLIMVIIAGTFSITFLMALTFGYVFAIRDLQDYNSIDEYIALFSCYRLYFINYCLNLTVYFAFDRRFRDEVIKLLKC